MTTEAKIDLYKLHKDEYLAPKKPVLLEIKPALYLAIEGQGAPGGEAFTAKIGALYGVAFTIKMTRKFAGHQDYTISKLEGQWWSDDGPDLGRVPRDQWRWKLLIRTPKFIGAGDVAQAAAVLLKRGKSAEVKCVSLEELKEGRCVQMLHLGPYESECETIALMQQFAELKGYRFDGRHHEIYLSDPRRVEPARLKTILREPVVNESAPLAGG